MNWYKLAAKTPFIDCVAVVVSASDRLVLMINGKRYLYSVAGYSYAATFDRLKKWKNKMEAGKKAYNIIKSLAHYLVKQ